MKSVEEMEAQIRELYYEIFGEDIPNPGELKNVKVSEETLSELRKIKGQLMVENGKAHTFDEVIKLTISCWKRKGKK